MMRVVGAVPRQATGPQYKRFSSVVGEHLLVVPQTRIYDIKSHDQDSGVASVTEWDALADAFARTIAMSSFPQEPMTSVVAPAPQSLSLNVSSSCNLACSYCYAERGGFNGQQPQPMTWEIARAAINRLLDQADAGSPITIGFMGGEPFVNRRLIHQTVNYAASVGTVRGLDVRFSVTTNGTLLQDTDIDILRSHRFAVTVSLDGDRSTHERQRGRADGKTGAYNQLSKAVTPLLEQPGLAQIAARATVTRINTDLQSTFAAITGLGFTDVGFAPLKSGPHPSDALSDDDWPVYLANLIALGRDELGRALQGQPLRLSNFAVALKQLHRGACSPYPCGAGGGYFSVAANGDWYTCHRAIGDDQFRVGNNLGLDESKRLAFLQQRHVHAQTACASCWARYLCSGSCHQEATLRTESFCGYVRGWLEFCLSAYCELSTYQPSFFATSSLVPPTH